MSDAVADTLPARPSLDGKPHASGMIIFAVLLAVGVGYILDGLISDIDVANRHRLPLARSCCWGSLC
jgi:hypothetical protein